MKVQLRHCVQYIFNKYYNCNQQLSPLYREQKLLLELLIVWSTTIMKCLLIGSFSVFALVQSGNKNKKQVSFNNCIISYG